MSAELAINSPVFLRYLLIVGGLLAIAGCVDQSEVVQEARGWLEWR